jgi:zinc transporter ZupT
MGLYKTLLFFAIVMGSGVGALYFIKGIDRSIKVLMSFTGAFILGIVFMHLIPVAYGSGNMFIGFIVLIGFLLQLLLEGLSKGVEHGHFHFHGDKKGKMALQVLIGLSIHSFIEGMPLASGFEHMLEHGDHEHHDHGHDHGHHHHHLLFGGSSLFWGIIAHHIPAAIALGAMLVSAGYSRIRAIFGLFIFTLMTPLGAWSTMLFDWSEQGFSLLIALVIGTFLHISTTILFEMEENHTISRRRLLAILLGLAIAVISSIL